MESFFFFLGSFSFGGGGGNKPQQQGLVGKNKKHTKNILKHKKGPHRINLDLFDP